MISVGAIQKLIYIFLNAPLRCVLAISDLLGEGGSRATTTLKSSSFTPERMHGDHMQKKGRQQSLPQLFLYVQKILYI